MAINSMGAPSYAPTRQESKTITTQGEYEQMRAAMERKAREEALKAREKARAASGYNDVANKYRNAPSTAEIMYATGADASQAANIRKWGDWENYTPEGGWDSIDLSTAQRAIHSDDWQAPEFQYKFSEPETAGSLSPYYKDLGNGKYQSTSTLLFSNNPGDTGSVIPLYSDKERFYNEAMGRGVGQAALDEYARSFGATNWQNLNWDRQVKQTHSTINNGTYVGHTQDYRGDPSLWSGDTYGLRGGDWAEPTLIGPDGSQTGLIDYASGPWANVSAKNAWLQAGRDYSNVLRNGIPGMNADFGKSMDDMNQKALLQQQGYSSLLGNGLIGGLINEDYANPWFGQITGREAPQSVFTTPEAGPYPWSSTSPQLDVSSLLAPGYGGPSGGGSMGSYGGAGGVGGLGGLGGKSFGQGGLGGPFGAKNPWSPS